MALCALALLAPHSQLIIGFAHDIELIGGDIVEDLRLAAWPLDFDCLSADRTSQPEIRAQVTLR